MKNKKLIRINRFIEVEDLGSEKLVNEVNVSHITLDQLLQIFEPHERGDPYLYDPYDINMEQLMQLNKYLDRPLVYDDKLDYTLATFGVYRNTVTGQMLE